MLGEMSVFGTKTDRVHYLSKLLRVRDSHVYDIMAALVGVYFRRYYQISTIVPKTLIIVAGGIFTHTYVTFGFGFDAIA